MTRYAVVEYDHCNGTVVSSIEEIEEFDELEIIKKHLTTDKWNHLKGDPEGIEFVRGNLSAYEVDPAIGKVLEIPKFRELIIERDFGEYEIAAAHDALAWALRCFRIE